MPTRIALLPAVVLLISFLATARSPDTSSRGLLLVTNKGDHTLSIIDPETGRQVGSVNEGGVTGHEVAALPDGKTAYVPIYGNSGVGSPGTDGKTMAIIDISGRRLIKTFDFPKPLRPHCAIYNRKDGLLYVTTELAHSVTVIDPRTLEIVGSIPTDQPESHMLAITHDGRRGFTSNVHVGTVTALDLTTRKVIAVIPVSPHAQRISVSMDDRRVFTADQTQPRLAVIDAETHRVKTWVALPGIAYGTAPTLDGRWLLVTIPAQGKIAVVDLRALKVARTIDVPKSPQEILVRPDDQVAYVSCHESRKVAAINLKAWKVDKIIQAGPLADGMAWAGMD